MTIFRSFKNMYLKPENEIKMFIHQFERMVAGFRCCQTWIQHPIQSDHARPRSDLHPHIFATKARWRGIAQPLCPATATAHLPNVLAVSGHSYWSVNPAIGSWTSGIIVRWRSCFLMDEHWWLPSSIFPSSKFFQQENCGGQLVICVISRPWSRRRPQEIRGQNGSPGGLGFKKATLTHHIPPPCPQNWSKSPSKHHSKWLLWSLACPLCVTSWARQLQPQLQCVKWHNTSRVWNIAITPSRSTEPTVASTVAVELQLRPLKKGIKKLQTRNFHEISRFLKHSFGPASAKDPWKKIEDSNWIWSTAQSKRPGSPGSARHGVPWTLPGTCSCKNSLAEIP